MPGDRQDCRDSFECLELGKLSEEDGDTPRAAGGTAAWHDVAREIFQICNQSAIHGSHIFHALISFHNKNGANNPIRPRVLQERVVLS